MNEKINPLDLWEDYRKVLNRHGYAFQYSVIRFAEDLYRQNQSVGDESGDIILISEKKPNIGERGEAGAGLIFAIRWPRVSLSFRKPLRPGPDANLMEMGYAELAWNR